MRLFFPPHLRVGVEPIAGPLPGVSQLLDLPPQGVLRDQDVVTRQVPPEQGHGPGGVRVAKLLRAFPKEAQEQVAPLLVEQGGPTWPVAVRQGGGITVLGVGGEPMVHGPRGHPQSARDRADGLAGGDFEDGQGTAVDSGVMGGPQLLLQTPPLPVGQGQGVHRPSSPTSGYQPSPRCEKTFA
jgi:hypothetical protein